MLVICINNEWLKVNNDPRTLNTVYDTLFSDSEYDNDTVIYLGF